MCNGVVPVGANVCDNEHVIKQGEVGHLVALGDDAGMARSIVSLLGNEILRQEMGRKARNWVIDEFSNHRLAEKMEAVYTELLAKKQK